MFSPFLVYFIQYLRSFSLIFFLYFAKFTHFLFVSLDFWHK